MSSTGTTGTATDMLTWAGKVHEASTSQLQATKEGLRAGEVGFHREEKANRSPNTEWSGLEKQSSKVKAE